MSSCRSRKGRSGKSKSLYVGQRNGSQTTNTSSTIRRTEERKEPENHHETLKILCQTLSTDDQPLIWYRATSDRHVAGHIIQKGRGASQNIFLVKTMANDLQLIRDDLIIRKVPDDISPEDVEWMMSYVSNLAADFEVRADITVTTEERRAWNLYSTKVETAREIVVKEWKLPSIMKSPRVHVKDPSVWNEWTSCAIADLKVIKASLSPLSPDTSDLQESFRKCKDDLDRSELENRKLKQKLDEQRALNESLETAMSEEQKNHESAISELQARSKQRISHLKTISSQKDQEIRVLKQNAQNKGSKIDQLQRTNQKKESQLREMRDQLAQQQTEAERQANESQRKVEDLTRTISAYEATQLLQKQEIQTLREDSDRNYRKVKQLEEIVPAYEHQEQVLAAEREKNKELQSRVQEKAQKLSELLGNSLTSIYSGLNFGSEMTELRNEKHDDAVDACVDDFRIPQEEALDLLFRIFMFCYEYFEGKMARFRSAWNLDGNENLERLFVIKMQENYKAMFDEDGLRRAYLETFSQELAHGCTDDRILAYMTACGELCWTVVLHLPKLRFHPRQRVIDPDEEVMFDSDRFKDFAGSVRKHGKARVVSYVLPGLYRIDSDVAIGKDAVPCVFTEKIVPKRTKSEEPIVVAKPPMAPQVATGEGAAVDDKQGVVEEIESDIWNGDVVDAKNRLAAIKWRTSNIEILCGDDTCGAVMFSRWMDYERALRNGGECQCPVDDAHDGVHIRKKW